MLSIFVTVLKKDKWTTLNFHLFVQYLGKNIVVSLTLNLTGYNKETLIENTYQKTFLINKLMRNLSKTLEFNSAFVICKKNYKMQKESRCSGCPFLNSYDSQLFFENSNGKYVIFGVIYRNYFCIKAPCDQVSIGL